MDIQHFWTTREFGSYINGRMAQGPKTDFISLLTQKPWKSMCLASRKDTRQAIEQAHRAFAIWKEVPSQERANILRNVGDLLLEHRVALSELMAYETGKSRKDGLGEVAYAAGFFHWFSGEAERLFNRQLPSANGTKSIHYIKEPVGVCGLITPWNFPLAMPARKLAAALAAGCTSVIKPSPECPFSSLFIALACQEAGVPPGAVNVLIGNEIEIGEELLSSPLVRKIGFTGSTDVGRYLYEHAALTLKKLSLELGGHAPAIVHEDADLDLAAQQLVVAKFRNNGQTCVAPNRIYVQKPVLDQFLEKFVQEVKKLKVGDPLFPDTDLTTCLHPSVPPKVQAHIDDALSKGAKAVLSGQNPFDPVILKDITHNMLITKEETFGPVAPVISFSEDNDAYRMANETPFGLASYLFTQNGRRIREGIKALEYGIIGVNDGLPSAPQLSFGGRKASGFGTEGGPFGIDEYLISKCASLFF